LGRLNMFPGDDPSIAGYRASAATARFSRLVAARLYGPHRPFGYAYGGSGGAFKTISGVENTRGVWDGSVPFVQGSPQSMPNVFTVQAHAMRILQGKFPGIVDAIEPGGSGDMYAGLNDEERDALQEVTRMGFPPRAWYAHQRIAFGYTGVFSTLIDNLLKWDPTYVSDFWSKPGYLGAAPPASLTAARVHHETTISAVILSDEAAALGLPLPITVQQAGTDVIVPAALRLAALPAGDLRGAGLKLTSGAAAGSTFYIIGVAGDLVIVGFGEANIQALASVAANDSIELDNAAYLASQTYHRHQLPGPDYPVWDQFLAPDGTPRYPQRAELLGPKYAFDGAGSLQSGHFDGKMIVVETLMDEAAYPWQADWYHTKVQAALGGAIDDQYRLYFIDHAMHTGLPANDDVAKPASATRMVVYTGVYQQALRDVSAWVEQGIIPPAGTRYQVVDGQVEVPPTAAERRGVQPVVSLTVAGGARADVAVGDEVELSGSAEVPDGAGLIVAAEWDFEGVGDYPLKSPVTPSTQLALSAKHTFSAPGTYFPVLRVTLQREGDASTPYTRILNIARVRVVVE
ncbi:MAG: hypothetical protein ABW321_18320, partial [Polyangiales bacterium]